MASEQRGHEHLVKNHLKNKSARARRAEIQELHEVSVLGKGSTVVTRCHDIPKLTYKKGLINIVGKITLCLFDVMGITVSCPIESVKEW